ncbi:hypothetical protein SanaruYs_30070 [Chryseotalea sanaruensis]|uniref:Trimeric autotransporter adhesin YadA-like head domain-containing protein n=1 Tax=Chryseotalea sanaruensis TaxID=2482724 RepID=A0A401UCY7_9BACT|nr:hypothetical protein [Chryseotalea sanaruensis]GCC52768.1 hypothetical protein SanaruYs_30070 [Chryseotalea sanaruensis]
MNRVILSALLLAVSSLAFAQNKSLGVGTSTPNPNAALHVESPTGNQGAIMPRLSTAQRTAMGGILGVADAGLLLYDNDLKGLFIWDGAAWQSSAKLQFPVVDTINTIPPNGNALRIVYNSTDTGNFGVAHFETINPNAAFSTLFARTTSATNGAADFVVSNPANNNDAIGVNTNALNGRAGAFSINNAGSQNFALYAQSNGDSTGAAVHGNNIGNGFGVYGKSLGSKFGSAAVYGLHEGIGDAAGAFRITNAGSPYASLYGETNGTGSAIFGNHLGTTGRAGQFQIGNAGNTSAALRGFTSGLGNAAFFTISNPVNDSTAILGETNGSGDAIKALNRGTGAAMYARAFGTNDAIYAEKQGGDGVGSAGNFQNQEPTNNASALFASTNAPAGLALGAFNFANGNAFAIFQGGMKVSTATLNAGTNTLITTRAVAYFIEDASSSFTFSGGVAFDEGDMIYIFNGDLGNNAIVDSLVIASNQGIVGIYMAGALRFFAYTAP